MQLNAHKHVLNFTFDARTSRGSLGGIRPVWLVELQADGYSGWGEAAPLPVLSPELPNNHYEGFDNLLGLHLEHFRQLDFGDWRPELQRLWPTAPAIAMSLEMALLDWEQGGQHLLFPSDFTEGQEAIPINGLIWMGSKEEMLQQIQQKIADGFSCFKLKIGAIDFDEELRLLGHIREHTAPETLLRVDANGAFAPAEAMEKLQALAQFNLHSIEQPIAAGQREAMAELCRSSPVPIALDEELIGCTDSDALLEQVKPQYVIYKPSLLGGFAATQAWINACKKTGTKWWLTSALESDLGLNAIAQFTASIAAEGHQGLGTGKLYSNNFSSPLQSEKGWLRYDVEGKFELEV